LSRSLLVLALLLFVVPIIFNSTLTFGVITLLTLLKLLILLLLELVVGALSCFVALLLLLFSSVTITFIKLPLLIKFLLRLLRFKCSLSFSVGVQRLAVVAAQHRAVVGVRPLAVVAVQHLAAADRHLAVARKYFVAAVDRRPAAVARNYLVAAVDMYPAVADRCLVAVAVAGKDLLEMSFDEQKQ
jgi:hypothetical protein